MQQQERWMDVKCLKCLGQHQSQTPRQGPSDGPMASACVGCSSVACVACSPARMPGDQGGPLRDVADSGGGAKCFSRAFCSPMPVRTRAPESPPLLHTAREGLGGLAATRKGRLGRTWDVAACTPHRLLSAMLLLFVRSGRHYCKHCCLCQSLGSRSFSL